jgi:anti-sigma B factor antagonist
MASPAERPTARFDVRAEDLEQAVVVNVVGEVDAATVPALRAGLADAATLRRPRYLVDLRRVTYLDSLGITALAQAFDQVRAQGGAVTAICGDRTAALLESLGLDAEIAIAGTRDQALALVDQSLQRGPASEADPSFRAPLRAARELIESGAVPVDDEELMRLRVALEEFPAAES